MMHGMGPGVMHGMGPKMMHAWNGMTLEWHVVVWVWKGMGLECNLPPQ